MINQELAPTLSGVSQCKNIVTKQFALDGEVEIVVARRFEVLSNGERIKRWHSSRISTVQWSSDSGIETDVVANVRHRVVTTLPQRIISV